MSARRPRMDPRYCRFRLEARASPIHRYGVFAAEPIPARRRVIEYAGRRITEAQAARLGTRRHIYLFSLGDDLMIDGATGGSGAEYINHSCEPNLIARQEGKRVWYSSLRPIAAGEELLVDYRLDSDDVYPCGCGAPSCRGVLNAPKEPPGEGSAPA